MTRLKTLPLTTVSAITLAAACWADTAQAETPATAPHGAEAGPAIEEVLVTARRREENLQDTPISITAFTADSLAARQVTNTADLGRLTPNLVTTTGQNISGNSSAGSYFIRGIGQIDFLLNTDPGVGVYVDGVYIARALGSFMDLVDLERVEVLRGPQGTLFGRNTIGGAVSLTTRKPGPQYAAGFDATVGSRDRRDVRGVVSGPLGDRAFASLAVLWRTQDGYVHRVTDDTRLGDIDSFAARAALRVQPTDRLTFDLAYDLVRESGTSPPAALVQVNESGAFPGFYNGAIAGPPCVPPPSPLNNPLCFNSQWTGGDPRVEHGTFTSRQKTDVDGFTVTAEWQLSGGVALKSISGYRRTRALGNRDGDHTPIPIQATTDLWSHTQKSEEVQLLGSALDDRLSWIVGGYLFSEEGSNANIVDFIVAKFVSGGAVDNRNYAGFGQLSYALTPTVKVTAGGRWSRDEKSFTPDQFVLIDRAGLFPPGSVPGFRLVPKQRFEASAEKFTPHVDISYQPTADVLVYARYSEGFKSGGFTQRIFPPLPAAPSFAPEKAKSYEAGAKLEGFGRRVRLNGAIFYTDYSDLQVQVLDGVQPLVKNAAAAGIKGFEAELLAIPAAGLRIEAGVGLTDAEYTSLNPDVLAAGVTRHSRFPQIPRWTGSLAVSYRADLPGDLSLTPRVDYTFQSATFLDAANTASLRQPGYGLLGASARLEGATWSLEGFARNLTDKRYYTGGLADLAVAGFAEAAIGRPREYGVALHLRY